MKIIISTTSNGQLSVDLEHEITDIHGKTYFETIDNKFADGLQELFIKAGEFFDQLNKERL